MKPVSMDGFFSFKFLSAVSFSPSGKSACFVVSDIDRKKDGYRSFIYLRSGGKVRRLTGLGKEKSFQYLDENTLLFPGNREQEEKNGPESRFYTIALDGGEAELKYTFPIPVHDIKPLPGGDLIVTGSTIPGFEELYKGEKKTLEAYKKHLKDNADYEHIEQFPWWRNGSSYTKGAYSSLFYYDAKRKKLIRLSEKDQNVFEVKLSPEKDKVCFLRTPVRPLLTRHGETELCELDLSSRETKVLARDDKKFSIYRFEMGESFILIMASDNSHGLNTDVDFYKLAYSGGKPGLLARHGESIGSSVGSDIRYGGGRQGKMEGDVYYFISTRFDCSYLFKLENGRITQLTFDQGSVDCFDVCGGKAMLIGLRDMNAQEIYDLQGRRLTRFNASALNGVYVARPETLNIEREGCEIHGFVLKPINYDPKKKYPVILNIHGGPKTVYGPVYYHEMQYWAGKGYFVIFCNPTGSDGRGDFMDIRGKYGTVDYEDIMAFTDAALKAYPAMDKKNLFETGGSYGGFMTNWIIGHTDRFRACVSQRSISNWFSFYGVSDIGIDFGTDQNACDPWSSFEKLWEHSPMKYADRAKTPTLFIHSFEDYRCPIDQGYQMFTSLIAHGVESKMVCFRGENHELSRSGKPSHRLKRLSEITGWFDSHRG